MSVMSVILGVVLLSQLYQLWLPSQVSIQANFVLSYLVFKLQPQFGKHSIALCLYCTALP